MRVSCLFFTDIVGNHDSMWICMQKCQEVSVENEDALWGDFSCVEIDSPDHNASDCYE